MITDDFQHQRRRGVSPAIGWVIFKSQQALNQDERSPALRRRQARLIDRRLESIDRQLGVEGLPAEAQRALEQTRARLEQRLIGDFKPDELEKRDDDPPIEPIAELQLLRPLASSTPIAPAEPISVAVSKPVQAPLVERRPPPLIVHGREINRATGKPFLPKGPRPKAEAQKQKEAPPGEQRLPPLIVHGREINRATGKPFLPKGPRPFLPKGPRPKTEAQKRREARARSGVLAKPLDLRSRAQRIKDTQRQQYRERLEAADDGEERKLTPIELQIEEGRRRVAERRAQRPSLRQQFSEARKQLGVVPEGFAGNKRHFLNEQLMNTSDRFLTKAEQEQAQRLRLTDRQQQAQTELKAVEDEIQAKVEKFKDQVLTFPEESQRLIALESKRLRALPKPDPEAVELEAQNAEDWGEQLAKQAIFREPLTKLEAVLEDIEFRRSRINFADGPEALEQLSERAAAQADQILGEFGATVHERLARDVPIARADKRKRFLASLKLKTQSREAGKVPLVLQRFGGPAVLKRFGVIE